jgi:hypothetical protein
LAGAIERDHAQNCVNKKSSLWVVTPGALQTLRANSAKSADLKSRRHHRKPEACATMSRDVTFR